LEVANLVANVGVVNDPEIITAALLHDTVEDTGVSFEEIAEKFGETVAGYVRELTDDKSLSKAERKQKAGREGSESFQRREADQTRRQDQQHSGRNE
jgi:(p)ppGpp synthase/HD superfamily hydrolase